MLQATCTEFSDFVSCRGLWWLYLKLSKNRSHLETLLWNLLNSLVLMNYKFFSSFFEDSLLVKWVVVCLEISITMK